MLCESLLCEKNNKNRLRFGKLKKTPRGVKVGAHDGSAEKKNVSHRVKSLKRTHQGTCCKDSSIWSLIFCLVV